MTELIMEEGNKFVVKSCNGFVELECLKGHISIKKRVNYKNLLEL